MEHKKCKKCCLIKDIESFRMNGVYRRNICKKCYSEYNNLYSKNNRTIMNGHAQNYRNKNKQILKEKSKIRKIKTLYGLDEKEFVRLLEKHNNSCAVCGSTKRLCVDHNHISGNIRGLLCFKCNIALGMVNDSKCILEKLKQYLIDCES